jgi:hypothetical protein
MGTKNTHPRRMLMQELHLSSDDDKDHVEELAKWLQQLMEGENTDD